MHPDLEAREPREPHDRALAQRLRQLPNELAPPFDYAELRRRAHAQGRSLRRRARIGTLVHAAAAAAGALAVIILGAAMLHPHRRPHAPALPDSPPLAADWRAVAPGEGGPRLSDASSTSEHWLANLPAEPVIVRVGTQLSVTDLEDRIAAVDDLLTAARLQREPDVPLKTLQYERTQLVDSLAQVRYAQSVAQLP